MNQSFFGAILFTLLQFSLLNAQNQNVNQGYKIGEIIDHIQRTYVDEVDGNELAETAIVKMLEELDPHSTYIPKDEVDDANEKINGSFVGIGIRFQILKDTLIVVQTIPGGPSEKVGLLAGDKIVIINNENVAGTGLKNAGVRERLLGEKGSKVTVEVARGKEKKNLKFTITRDQIPVHSVDTYYMVAPEIGYLKLNSFSRTTIEEMTVGIESLKKQGMKSFVLDLQGNGGGLLQAAQLVADMFLSGDKLVVYSEGKSQPRTDLNAGYYSLFENGKMVVLTDEYSASASEIVSGAIQDWDRGLIVGRRTFGKGLVQRPINLSDGSQLRLTIARYYTPTGRFIQKPYDDLESYRQDLTQRYLNGEFSVMDSIKFPDSLKHKTMITKRTVYSGGGIMPDVFVPLDTSEFTDLYRQLARSGVLNTFVLTYLQTHRKKIEKENPTFVDFKNQFKIDQSMETEFIRYAKAEIKDLKWDETEWKISERLIHSRLKASFAQDLWGISEFYQIYNENNEILQKAIQLLSSADYDKMNLAQNQSNR